MFYIHIFLSIDFNFHISNIQIVFDIKKHVNITDWYCNKCLVFCVILLTNKIVDINKIMMSPCPVSRSFTTKKDHPKSKWKLNRKQHDCLWWICSILMIFGQIMFQWVFFNYSDINNWKKCQISWYLFVTMMIIQHVLINTICRFSFVFFF